MHILSLRTEKKIRYFIFDKRYSCNHDNGQYWLSVARWASCKSHAGHQEDCITMPLAVVFIFIFRLFAHVVLCRMPSKPDRFISFSLPPMHSGASLPCCCQERHGAPLGVRYPGYIVELFCIWISSGICRISFGAAAPGHSDSASGHHRHPAELLRRNQCYRTPGVCRFLPPKV